MKNRISEKPNMRRGASITIALVIFMLCSLAGASAFFMASSNMGRYSHSGDQEYYSTSSAALMFVDLLDNLTYTSPEIRYDYVREWNYTASQHQSSDSYQLTIPPSESLETAMGKGQASTLRNSNLNLVGTIHDQCDLLVKYLNVPEEWYLQVQNQEGAPEKPKPEEVKTVSCDFTVNVQDDKGNSDSKFETVNGKLVMNANYDLILTFDGGNGEYAITVYWVADVKPVQTTGKPEYVYAEGSAVDEEGNYSIGTMTQKRTLQVTVKWVKANATISRGEAIQK